ncbi:MAG: Na+/H+ antiporter subunit E [Bacillota bacterium]
MGKTFIVILLYLVWVILSSDLSIPALILGLFISLSVDYVIRHSSFTKKVAEKFIKNFFLFLWNGVIIATAVFVASYKIAYFVLSPHKKFNPGIIKLEVDLGENNNIMKLTILANIITLTPGTVAIAANINTNELYIHWMDVEEGSEEEIKEKMIDNFDDIVRRMLS